MERLKYMKEALMNCVQGQIGGNLEQVDTKELGEAIDMIKDLEQAIYYKSITEAMEKSEKEKENMGHIEKMYYTPMYPPFDYDINKYYSEGGRYNGDGNSYRGMTTSDGGSNSNYNYRIPDSYNIQPIRMRDYREGRSPMMRKMYMESKEMHKDKEIRMEELEKYIQELGTDITEMIEEASPEEKRMLQQKITTLANKITM